MNTPLAKLLVFQADVRTMCALHGIDPDPIIVEAKNEAEATGEEWLNLFEEKARAEAWKRSKEGER